MRRKGVNVRADNLRVCTYRARVQLARKARLHQKSGIRSFAAEVRAAVGESATKWPLPVSDDQNGRFFLGRRILLRWTSQPARVSAGAEREGETTYEFERQAGYWNTHGSGDVPADIRTSKRWPAARRGVGAVSDDGRCVVDFRFAVCEAQIAGWFPWPE
jgi:hypothetical protein